MRQNIVWLKLVILKPAWNKPTCSERPDPVLSVCVWIELWECVCVCVCVCVAAESWRSHSQVSVVADPPAAPSNCKCVQQIQKPQACFSWPANRHTLTEPAGLRPAVCVCVCVCACVSLNRTALCVTYYHSVINTSAKLDCKHRDSLSERRNNMWGHINLDRPLTSCLAPG